MSMSKKQIEEMLDANQDAKIMRLRDRIAELEAQLEGLRKPQKMSMREVAWVDSNGDALPNSVRDKMNELINNEREYSRLIGMSYQECRDVLDKLENDLRESLIRRDELLAKFAEATQQIEELRKQEPVPPEGSKS